MILCSPPENENTDLVMPAWIAGIQARKDASGDIHVDLDSSNPCWNDTIEGARLEPTAARCSKRSRRFRIVNLNFVPSSTGQALRSRGSELQLKSCVSFAVESSFLRALRAL